MVIYRKKYLFLTIKIYQTGLPLHWLQSLCVLLDRRYELEQTQRIL